MTLAEAVAQVSRGLSHEYLDPDTKAALTWLERFVVADQGDLCLHDRGFVLTCRCAAPLLATIKDWPFDFRSR